MNSTFLIKYNCPISRNGLKMSPQKYSEENKGDGQQNIWYQEQTIQLKALIWDYCYTEPKLSTVNYINLIMTHSSIWCNKKKKKKEKQVKFKSCTELWFCHLFFY